MIKNELKQFIQMPVFTSKWDQFKLTNNDLENLENEIVRNLKSHDIIPGTGGLRKCRISSEIDERGKSGSFRVCYLSLDEETRILLILMYSKKDQSDLTEEQKKLVKKVVQGIKRDSKR